MEFDVKIKILREGAVVPKIATAGSAAADLCACINEEIVIAPGKTALLPTGFAPTRPPARGDDLGARPSRSSRRVSRSLRSRRICAYSCAVFTPSGGTRHSRPVPIKSSRCA